MIRQVVSSAIVLALLMGCKGKTYSVQREIKSMRGENYSFPQDTLPEVLEFKWKKAFLNDWETFPISLQGGLLWNSQGHRPNALNPASGQIDGGLKGFASWTEGKSYPATKYGEHLLVATSQRLSKINPFTQEVALQFPIQTAIFPPVVAGEDLFVVDKSRHLYSYSLQTGELTWKLTAEEQVGFLEEENSYMANSSLGFIQGILSNGEFVFLNILNRWFCIAPEEGEVVWSLSNEENSKRAKLSVQGETVALADSYGTLKTLSASSGSEDLVVEHEVTGANGKLGTDTRNWVVSEEVLYIINSGVGVTAYDLFNGEQLWFSDVSFEKFLTRPNVLKEELVLGGEKHLIRIRKQDGALLSKTPLPESSKPNPAFGPSGYVLAVEGAVFYNKNGMIFLFE